MRSPLLPAGLSIAALLASLSRWVVQDSGNLYTALEKRFYIPDPDLGWRVSAAHPVWIGLDVCAVVAAIAIGLMVGGHVVRRRRSRSTFLRAAAWTLGAVASLVPLAAFASGARPSGAIDALPLDAAQPLARDAIAGELEAPAGRYEVVPHEGTWITARLSAGGETFDARFAGDVEGFWRGDPHDLASPMTATVSVAAASVDTGVRARSKHARTGYLEADTHPRITVDLDRLVAAQPAGAGGVRFIAQGGVAGAALQPLRALGHRWYRFRMERTYEAWCHCRAVRFKFRSEEIEKGCRCNCSICVRKGIVLSARYFAPEEIVELVGVESLTVYRFGDRGLDHCFCRVCGIAPFVVVTAVPEGYGGPARPGCYRLNLGCVDGLDAFALEGSVIDGRAL